MDFSIVKKALTYRPLHSTILNITATKSIKRKVNEMELYYTPEQLANMIASNHKNLNYIDSLVEKGILKVSKTVLPNQIQKMEYYNTKDEHIITMHKG